MVSCNVWLLLITKLVEQAKKKLIRFINSETLPSAITELEVIFLPPHFQINRT